MNRLNRPDKPDRRQIVLDVSGMTPDDVWDNGKLCVQSMGLDVERETAMYELVAAYSAVRAHLLRLEELGMKVNVMVSVEGTV